MSDATGRGVHWRRSTACADSACVEVAFDEVDVQMRASVDPDGPRLRFPRRSWGAFLTGLRVEGAGDR
jgi:hypothetical protein